MDQGEILEELRRTVANFLNPKTFGTKETPAEAEARQSSAILELFGMLRLPVAEIQQVVLDCAQKLSQKRHHTMALLCCGFFEELCRKQEKDEEARRAQARLQGVDVDDQPLNLNLLSQKIQCKYLTEIGSFHLAVEKGADFQHKSSVAQCCAHLKGICEAMKQAFPHDEELYHTIFNGTIHLYLASVELIKGYCFPEAIVFLAWAAQACSATLTLSQTKFLPWRVKLMHAIAYCYDRMGDTASAERVSQQTLKEVKELYDLEFSDMVQPSATTIDTLRRCLYDCQGHSFKYMAASLEKGEADAAKGKGGAALTVDVVRQKLEAAIPGPRHDTTSSQPNGKTTVKGDGGRDDRWFVPAAVSALIGAVTLEHRRPVFPVSGPLQPPSFPMKTQPSTVSPTVAAVLLQTTDALLSAPSKSDPSSTCSSMVSADVLNDYIKQLYTWGMTDLFAKWAAAVEQRIAEQDDSNSQVLLLDVKIFRALSQLPSTPAGPGESAALPAYAHLCTLLTQALEMSAYLTQFPDTISDAASLVYRLMTNDGHDETVRKLPSQGYDILRIVCTVWVRTPNFDLGRIGSAVLLYAKWSEAEIAEQYPRGERAERLGEVLGLVQELHVLVAERRRQYVQGGEEGAKGFRVSDSLQWGTIVLQHTELQRTALRLRLEVAVEKLYRKRVKEQAHRVGLLRKRNEQSHIFGVLSTKEQTIMHYEEEKAAEVPSASPAMEKELLEGAAGDPSTLFLIHIEAVRFHPKTKERRVHLEAAKKHAEAVVQADQELRRRHNVADGTRIITATGSPPEYLWCILAVAAKECQNGGLAEEAFKMFSGRFIHPVATETLQRTNQQMTANIILCDSIRENVLRDLPTMQLDALAEACIATADAHIARIGGTGTMKDDPNHGHDVQRYRLASQQQTRLRVANILMIALQVADLVKNPRTVVTASNKLFNCLSPMFRGRSRPVYLLRPLVLIIKVLVELEGEMLSSPNFQALLVRFLWELVHTVEGVPEKQPLVPVVVNLFCDAWTLVRSNPNEYQTRHLARLARDIERYHRDRSGGGGGPRVSFVGQDPKTAKKGKAPADKAGGGGAGGTALLLREVTVDDELPLEYTELLDYLVFYLKGSVPVLLSRNEASGGKLLSPIYCTVAPLIHSQPHAALEELNHQYRSHPLYPKLLVHSIMVLCSGKQLRRALEATEGGIAVIKERYQALCKAEEAALKPIEEGLQGLKEGRTSEKKDEGGKGKGGKSPPPEADPNPPESRAAEVAMQRAGLALQHFRLRIRFRKRREQLLKSDVGYQATLNEIKAMLHFIQICDRRDSKRRNAVSMSQEVDSDAEDDLPGGGEEEEPPLTPEETQEYWKGEVSVVQSLTRALVLYARVQRWKHAVKVIANLRDTTALMFSSNGGTLPVVLPIPLEALPLDPSQHPPAALVELQPSERTGTRPQDGLALCQKEMRAALVHLVMLLEDVEGGVDLRDYVDSLHHLCIETCGDRMAPGGLLARSVCLRVVTSDKGREAFKLLLEAERKDCSRWVHAELRYSVESEFRGRAAIEHEEQASWKEILSVKDGDEQPDDEGSKEPAAASAPASRITAGGVTVITVRSKADLDGELRALARDGVTSLSFMAGYPVCGVYLGYEVLLDVSNIHELLQASLTSRSLRIGIAAPASRARGVLAASIRQGDPKAPQKAGWNLVAGQLAGLGNLATGLLDLNGLPHDTTVAVTDPVEGLLTEVLLADLGAYRGRTYMYITTLTVPLPPVAPDGALTPAPPTTRKRAKEPDRSKDIPFLERMGSVDMEMVVGLAVYCMKAMQFSALSPYPAAVRFGEELNAILRGNYALQILPTVMAFQAAVGRSLTKAKEEMTIVYRDIPRAAALGNSVRTAVDYYKRSLLWQEVQTEVARRLEGATDRLTIAVSTTTRGSGRHSTLRNAQYRDIIARFTLHFSFLRQKHVTFPAMQVANSMASFHFEHLNLKEAAKAWHDGVDIAFSEVNAWQKWRRLALVEDSVLLEQMGLPKMLLCIIMLHKLASEIYGRTNHYAAAEHTLLAARLCRAVLGSTLSTPPKEYDFRLYTPTEILDGVDCFSGPLGVDPIELTRALAFVAHKVLTLGHAVLALPVVSLLGHVGCDVVRSLEYTVMARVLRVRALSAIGDHEGSTTVLHTVYLADSLPNKAAMMCGVMMDPLPEETPSTSPADAKAKGKPADTKKGKVTPVEPVVGVERIPAVNHRSIGDKANKAAISHFRSFVVPLPLQPLIGPHLANAIELTHAYALLCLAGSDPLACLEPYSPIASVDPYEKALPPKGGGDMAAKENCYAALQIAEEVIQRVLAAVPKEEPSTGWRTAAVQARLAWAKVQMLRGNLPKAEHLLHKILEEVEDGGMEHGMVEKSLVTVSVREVASVMHLLAEVLLVQQQYQAAIEVTNRCEKTLCAKYSCKYGAREARLLRARVQLLQGYPARAFRTLTEPRVDSKHHEGDSDVEEDEAQPKTARRVPIFSSDKARVTAPTRLRKEGTAASPLLDGGGILEGMVVTILRADDDYTLVRRDDGVQGFMPTKDLRCDQDTDEKVVEKTPQMMPSLVREATDCDVEGRDLFLARVLSTEAVACYVDRLQGSLDASAGRLIKAAHQNMDIDALRRGRKRADEGEEDPALKIALHLRKAVELYRLHIGHIGVTVDLDFEKWGHLGNRHPVVVAREACCAMLRLIEFVNIKEEHEEALSLSHECLMLATQCCTVLPVMLHEALFEVGRCKRRLCLKASPELDPSWGSCGISRGEPVLSGKLESSDISHTEGAD
eukprot:Sspe_Gene.57728::Locus_31675_Transcript_1_1_Confidence_1.000_Length_8397::g.57728::m.57728